MAREGRGEGDEMDGGRGSQVWQTQDLREGVLGSVAMIGVTGEFSEVWQIQELATFWRKAGVGEATVRSAARRGRMGLARQAIDRAVSESQKPLYYIFTICQAINKSFRCKRLGGGIVTGHAVGHEAL